MKFAQPVAPPAAVLTDTGDQFVELPSGRVVEPLSWLREHARSHVLWGFLAYEFGWTTCNPAVPRPRSRCPRCWVGVWPIETWREGEAPRSGGRRAPCDVTCDVTPDQYAANVQRCIDDIWNGELFEINYTERFRTTWDGTPEELYALMASRSTGEWFGFLAPSGPRAASPHFEDFAIASVSPEMLIRVRDGHVVTRPIKGTRRRSDDPAEDARLAAELLASGKDRAENVMIVDLMRNDLTKVCVPGSVQATAVCELESFAAVHHLVSTVEGQLRPDLLPIDALLACFPAGSITGAPKLRAMELAATYEASARGAYTGSMFVSHPDGRLDSNVLIRTATLFRTDDGWDVEYGAGGAVVSDSSPMGEWEEAVAKLAPVGRFWSAGGSPAQYEEPP